MGGGASKKASTKKAPEKKAPESVPIVVRGMAGSEVLSCEFKLDGTVLELINLVKEEGGIDSNRLQLMHQGTLLQSSSKLSEAGCDVSSPVELTVVVGKPIEVVFAQVGMCRFTGYQSKGKGYCTYEEAEAAFLADEECMYMDLARVRGGKYDTFLFHDSSRTYDLDKLPPLDGPHDPNSGITFKKVYTQEAEETNQASVSDSTDKVVFAQSGMCRFPGWQAKGQGYLTYEEAMAALLADKDGMFMDMARPKGNKYDTFLFFDKTGRCRPGNLPTLEGPHGPGSGTTFKKVSVQKTAEKVTEVDPATAEPSAMKVMFAQVGMCRFAGWQAKGKGYLTYEEAEAAFLADEECMYMDLARFRDGRYDAFLFHNSSRKCDPNNLPPLEGPHGPDSGITFKKVYVQEGEASNQCNNAETNETNETNNVASNSTDTVVFAQTGMCRFPGWQAKGQGYLTYEEAMAALLADEDCIFMDMARPKGDKYDTFLFFDSTGRHRPGSLPKLEGPHPPGSGTTFKKVRV